MYGPIQPSTLLGPKSTPLSRLLRVCLLLFVISTHSKTIVTSPNKYMGFSIKQTLIDKIAI